MIPHSFFVFVAQHALELTITVIVIAFIFILARSNTTNTNKHESPLPFKSYNSSSYQSTQSHIVNPTNQTANQINQIKPIQSNKSFKLSQPPINKPNTPPNNKKPIKKPQHVHFKSSKVFWSNTKPINKHKNVNKQQLQTIIQTDNKSKNNNKKNEMSRLRNELDMSCHPEYLDGYASLSENQKIFLTHIKNNNLSEIKDMISIHPCYEIINDFNFGECQILRECVLSNRLNILKYLKKQFTKKLNLNSESGYCLRWAARKGLFNIANWLLCEQKYEEIDITYFQFQAIEWSIVYGHKRIAILLQKLYKDWKLNTKWNVLAESQLNISFEFDIFNLPSIYQQIIELIIHSDNNNNNIQIVKKYYRNGCDLCFENNMPWKVAVDCMNIYMLQFLYDSVGVNPICCGNYLLTTALQNNGIQLLKFAKRVINYEMWKESIEPNMNQLKELCNNNKELINELDNYYINDNNMPLTPPDKKRMKLVNNNMKEIPKTPIPWPYKDVKEQYGYLTRSKRKILIKKGILASNKNR